MHAASFAAYAAGLALLLSAGYLAIIAAVHVHLRLGRYRQSDVGIDHETLYDELTTHFHLTLVEPMPQASRAPPWWQRLG
ncbi:MAG: hypothetical protein JWR16_3624 [Nevskia sp.]|nr:hypothetical protein [Nevskia sp.]